MAQSISKYDLNGRLGEMKEYIVAVPEHLAGDLFRGDPELIRCKDCVYSKRNPREQSIHQYICEWHDMSVFGHYYCGTAEKRKEE